MTLRQWQPGTGLADTTALTTGNTLDVTGVVAISLSAGTGTRTASSTHARSGVNNAKIDAASGQNSVLRYPFATASTTGAVEWLFYYGALPASTPDGIAGPTDGGSVNPWTLNVNNSTGKLSVTITGGTTIWQSTAGLTPGNWYRFAAKYVIATTSTGTFQCAYYSDQSATAIETSSALTGLNLGTGAPTSLEIGRRNLPAQAMTMWHADVQVNDGATAFIGPLVAYGALYEMWATVADNPVTYGALLEMYATSAGAGTYGALLELWATSSSALTVALGADVTYEPNVVGKLTPTFSNPPASVVYAQTAGPTVALVGTGLNRAYLTPALAAGATLTFQVTATPAGGGTPVADTVTHAIYPQLAWILNTATQRRPVHRGATPTVIPDP